MNNNPALHILGAMFSLLICWLIWKGIGKLWEAGWLQSVAGSLLKLLAALLLIGLIAQCVSDGGGNSCVGLTARYC